ncbi:MAG TPA: T9SS type A sorting domain-containing protein [Flavipsychrobacter sp.]|nr:T9SS type A sorting domain-containing protein [Flavipsychrobacter sp.]
MKQSFFLFILLQAFFNSKGQHTYIPIPEDSAVWITVREDWQEGIPGNPPHEFRYMVSRTEGIDTTVLGRRYFCLYGKWFDNGMPLPPPGNQPARDAIWLHQDTAAKKIWFVYDKGVPPNYIPKEYLLYDFSLQAGDTITDSTHRHFYQRILPHKAWVDLVDSIYWQDGTWRYRWFIKSTYGSSTGLPTAQTVIIEGMGYTNDFWEFPFYRWMGVVGLTYEMTCFKLKNQWLYHQPNPWNFDCDSMLSRDLVVGINEAPPNDLEQPLLYPNPVPSDGILTLNTYTHRPNENITIKAYDITGKLKLTSRMRPGERIQLSQYSVQPGVYMFQLFDSKNNLFHSMKIIINNY